MKRVRPKHLETECEIAIAKAIDSVQRITGFDKRLRHAAFKLVDAKNLVAEYVDEQLEELIK